MRSLRKYLDIKNKQTSTDYGHDNQFAGGSALKGQSSIENQQPSTPTQDDQESTEEDREKDEED